MLKVQQLQLTFPTSPTPNTMFVLVDNLQDGVASSVVIIDITGIVAILSRCRNAIGRGVWDDIVIIVTVGNKRQDDISWALSQYAPKLFQLTAANPK